MSHQRFLIIAVAFLVLCLLWKVGSSERECPSWTTVKWPEDGCTCGASIKGAIECDNHTMQTVVYLGWCVTLYDESTIENSKEEGRPLVAGLCPSLSRLNSSTRASFILPRNRDRLQSAVCGPYLRKGLLCAECESGYGPTAYSFDWHCSNCSYMSTATAVLVYFLLDSVPIAILFLLFMAFQVNIMSGPLFGYVVFCQYVIVVSSNNGEIYKSVMSHLLYPLELLCRLSLTMSAVWSLLFFRYIVPPFCISEKLKGFYLIALKFSTAIVPLCLVGIVFFVMETNLRKFQPLKQICNCISKVFSFINKYVPIRGSDSVVHVFATFILLSISVVTIQTNLLTTVVPLYNVSGGIIEWVLYHDPLVKKYNTVHIFFLVLAFVLMLILILCPALVLLVYPTSFYAQISRSLSPRKQIAIKIFAETFQGSFKDGLNGTRDYRVVPGLAVLTAFLYNAAELFFNQHIGSVATTYIVGGFINIAISFGFAYTQPCKTWGTNISLIFHFNLLGVWSIIFGLWVQDTLLSTQLVPLAIIFLPAIPHLIMAIWIMRKVCVFLKEYWTRRKTAGRDGEDGGHGGEGENDAEREALVNREGGEAVGRRLEENVSDTQEVYEREGGGLVGGMDSPPHQGLRSMIKWWRERRSSREAPFSSTPTLSGSGYGALDSVA